ncbi:MAG: type IV secretory system conjugative DNA transfer family protein [Atopobiaceae bacterium]|nr:type IV secretory system conjugative DNA transfer family protein [Atopobiaceae bacterium]
MKTRKSFNRGPSWNPLPLIVIWVFLIASVFTALPFVWELLTDMLKSGSLHTLFRGLPRSLPALADIVYFICAALTIPLSISIFVSQAKGTHAFHDGTWVGGKRAPVAVHGDAWLESRPTVIKKYMLLWEENKSCEPGLVVGSIDNTELVRPFINAIMFGAPGSGKTRRVLLPTVTELIVSAKASVLVLDPKGEIRDFTSSFAKSRGLDIYDIRLDEPSKSMRYDLFGPALRAMAEGDVGLSIAHLRELATTLIPEMAGSNKYFSDAARELFVGLATWLLENPEIPEEQKHIGSVLSLLQPKGDKSTAERIMELARTLTDEDPAKPRLSGITGDNTASAGVISNLITTLSDTCDERVSRMLYDSELDFASLGQSPSICYLSFTTDTGSYTRLTTAIVSQALAALLGEARKGGGTLSTPVYFVLEEFGQLAPIKRLIADAGIMRAEGIHLLMVLQDRNQLEAQGYSKAQVETLLGMVDDTLILKLNDIETATLLSKRLGTYTVKTQSQSASKSSKGGSSSMSHQTAKRDLISPSELTEWSADIGLLLIGADANYALPCPELSQRFVNELLGMGDEVTNLQIRLDAQRNSELKNTEKPPIWTDTPSSKSIDLPSPLSTLDFDPLA